MAMYDRAIAMRVAERTAALGRLRRHDDRATLRALDDRYDLDVLRRARAGAPFDLPVLYRNAQFVIYDLR